MWRGFIKPEKLYQELGECKALLMTHKWVEAFGNNVIEAMACGVPVIAYARGGPTETIQEGINGYLVKADDANEVVRALAKVDSIDRKCCAESVHALYSLSAYADRLLAWFASNK